MDYIQPPEFAEVIVSGYNRQACSPLQQEIGWTGVALRAPQTVRGPAQPFVPVCGFYMAPATSRRVVAGTLHYTIAGKPAAAVEIPVAATENVVLPPPVPDAELAGVRHGGYFSFDLATYVSLPAQSAQITLTVEIQGLESAPVTIAWEPR